MIGRRAGGNRQRWQTVEDSGNRAHLGKKTSNTDSNQFNRIDDKTILNYSGWKKKLTTTRSTLLCQQRTPERSHKIPVNSGGTPIHR